MIDKRWWERYPLVLAAEHRSLDDLGIVWSRDDTAYNLGVMRLNLPEVDVAGELVDLVVTYPDLYPYFRFEIDAPGLDLLYHQNPFIKNLCVMGRRTDNWHVGDAVGHLIQTQLPKVIKAGRITTAGEASELEEHQAEPFTDYYGYLQGSIVLIEERIVLNNSHTHGACWIGIREAIGKPPAKPLRGAIIKLETDAGRTLVEASPSISNLYGKGKLKGVWRRLDQPPRVDGLEFIKFLRDQDPRFSSLPRNEVEGGQLCIAAAVFPVEQSWRSDHGDGWVFACEFIPSANSLALNPHGFR
jgi:hypothetical protein